MLGQYMNEAQRQPGASLQIWVRRVNFLVHPRLRLDIGPPHDLPLFLPLCCIMWRPVASSQYAIGFVCKLSCPTSVASDLSLLHTFLSQITIASYLPFNINVFLWEESLSNPSEIAGLCLPTSPVFCE